MNCILVGGRGLRSMTRNIFYLLFIWFLGESLNFDSNVNLVANNLVKVYSHSEDFTNLQKNRMENRVCDTPNFISTLCLPPPL